MYKITIKHKNPKIPDDIANFNTLDNLEYFLKVLNKETIKTIYVDDKLYYKAKSKFSLVALIITVTLILAITAGTLYIVTNPEKFSTTYKYHNIARNGEND